MRFLKGHSLLYHKDVGLVSEVFTPRVMDRLPKSGAAIGHVRYSTTGGNTKNNVQPIITEFLTGRIATAHNGNIVNAKALKEKLETCGLDFAATTDSEVISSLIAYKTLKTGNVFDGVVVGGKGIGWSVFSCGSYRGS